MKRAALSLMLLSGCAVALSPSDLTLTDFEVSTNAVDVSSAPASITCDMTLTTSGDAGFDATCVITSPSGRQYACPAYDHVANVWSCDVTIPQDAEQGTGGTPYVVEYVAARDTSFATGVTTYAEMVSDIPNVIPNEAALQIAVTSTSEDITGPIINSTTATPGTIYAFAGGPVSCTNTIAGGDAAVAGCTWVAPSGAGGKSGNVACDITAGAGGVGGAGNDWTCEAPLPVDAPSGTWGVDAFARDSIGNRTNDQGAETLEVADLAYEGCTGPHGLHPIAVVLTGGGIPYYLSEFNTELRTTLSNSQCFGATEYTFPHHASVNPYYQPLTQNNGKNSASAESVVWGDSLVWASQGGGTRYDQGINHSRVYSYDGTFKAYNMPGNRNEIIGLHWDATRGLIWVAEGGWYADYSDGAGGASGTKRQGTIIAFDPDTAAFDNDHLWPGDGNEPDTSLDSELCAGSYGGAGGYETPTADSCFKRYALPTADFDADPVGAFNTAHLLVDGDGYVWFTNFLGATIGRLDPDTEEVIIYPLGQRNDQCTDCNEFGAAPWEIELSPDGLYVVWTEFLDSTISRMPISMAEDSSCQSLDLTGAGGAGGGIDRRGVNPCVEELLIPADLAQQQAVHSLAFDADGRAWFTQVSFADLSILNKIGFADAAWTTITMLDVDDTTPDYNAVVDTTSKSFAGIAINQSTGEMWIPTHGDSQDLTHITLE